MKLNKLIFIFLAIFLTACNFSLAEDITPPPNYIAPTPMPTLGPLYPAEAPSLENGAAIYAEKCVECHGPQGMGDGDKGKQLPVTVAALGLDQVARAAAPADWYTMVTRGNIERYMPPFSSINQQERWDVVAYALSLHTSEEIIARGKEIFESSCANCPLDVFQNQTEMASLSADQIVILLKNGGENVTALSGSLTDDDYYAVAAYLRTLTFAVTLPTPTPEPATPTPTVSAPEATPSAAGETTPSVEGTPATETSATPAAPEATATPIVSGIKVSGSVSGANVANLTVTLRGFDHATADAASGPEETVTLTAVTDANGQYVFEGLEIVENRIFFAEVDYLGVTYSSDAVVLAADSTDVAVPAFIVYETSEDFSVLRFDQAHFFIEVADGMLQVIGVYTFSNSGDKTIVITTPMDVPFLKTPADAQNVGFDLTQDSAPIVSAGETGFAMPPSETPYGFVAFYTLPYDGKAQINQPFALPASSVLVLVPDGMKVKSTQLTGGELQTFQETMYQTYSGEGLKSGDTLTIDLSGQPKSGGSSDSRQGLLIGVGALGAALILAGAWMYLRDRKRSDGVEPDEEDEEDDDQSEEDLLDAIIVLDDLHRAGKISDEAYQVRRAELKARLKNVM